MTSRPLAAPATGADGGGRLFCLAEIWWPSETRPYLGAHAISRFNFNLLHSPVQQCSCPSHIVQALASDFAKYNYGCAGFQLRLNFDWLLLQLYYISIRCWHLSILIHFELYRNEFSQCWWGLWEQLMCYVLVPVLLAQSYCKCRWGILSSFLMIIYIRRGFTSVCV